MKKLIFILLLLTSCKSSFFTYERQLPAYPLDTKIIVVKLTKQTPDYSIYKLRAVGDRIPFYYKTQYKFMIGSIVNFALIKSNDKTWYF